MDFNDLKGMFTEVKGRMDGSIERVRKEMAHVRTGRATVGLLDGIQRHLEALGTNLRSSAAQVPPGADERGSGGPPR